MTIVHESMHAELDARGTKYVEGERAQIEIQCVQAELRFAETIPGAEPLQDWIKRRLERHKAEGEAPWTDARFEAKRLAAVAESVADLKRKGAPVWLVRALIRFTQFLTDRAPN